MVMIPVPHKSSSGCPETECSHEELQTIRDWERAIGSNPELQGFRDWLMKLGLTETQAVRAVCAALIAIFSPQAREERQSPKRPYVPE